MGLANIKDTIDKQRIFFESNATRDINFRIEQLKRLKQAVKNNEDALYQALNADFKKPRFESYVSEIGIVYEEISCMLKNIKKWAAPKHVKGNTANFPSQNFIYPDPFGVTLIIGAWNYPFQLTISPVVGAIAAGNTCIIKPPRTALNTYRATQKMIRETFEDHFLAVLDENSDNTEMLSYQYDYIFFTGSVEIGKTIARAAAEHLTPTTLELGGKSPCIVDENVDMEMAARRIAWGKFVNGGQTCVAPDYLLLHEGVKEKFYKAFATAVRHFYGNNPEDSVDYPRIINDKHFNRLSAMLKDGNIILGGKMDAKTKYIAPTLMEIHSLEHPLMLDEIFGPILPVLPIQSIDEAISIVKKFEKPLAFYLFTSSEAAQQKCLNTLQFGGGSINDTVVHFANSNLPFGGVGNSGMGAYHGKFSFDTFTHKKAVCNKAVWLDVPLRYPPYTKRKFGLAKQLLQ
jgi:aldehyde dehydrogenase (NAD+)